MTITKTVRVRVSLVLRPFKLLSPPPRSSGTPHLSLPPSPSLRQPSESPPSKPPSPEPTGSSRDHRSPSPTGRLGAQSPMHERRDQIGLVLQQRGTPESLPSPSLATALGLDRHPAQPRAVKLAGYPKTSLPLRLMQQVPPHTLCPSPVKAPLTAHRKKEFWSTGGWGTIFRTSGACWC